jgi:hypothetical protein
MDLLKEEGQLEDNDEMIITKSPIFIGIYLSNYLSIYLIIYLSIYLIIYITIYLSLYRCDEI